MGKKGFTLIELIVVIAILVILIGVSTPMIIQYVNSTREKADKILTEDVLNNAKVCLLTKRSSGETINSESITQAVLAKYMGNNEYPIFSVGDNPAVFNVPTTYATGKSIGIYAAPREITVVMFEDGAETALKYTISV